MRKFLSMMMVLVMCLCIAAPAYAAGDDFVPSIVYKPSPDIVAVEDENGEEAIGVVRDESGEIMDYIEEACLIVTPIAYIWDEEIEVPEEVETLLTFVYEGLNSHDMEIPYDKHGANFDAGNMVIRDLFDARWSCEDHFTMIEKDGVVFEITFDMGVEPDAEIYAMSYDEETKEWSPIEKTVNNGDGTVTCTFEHLCAIEFSMPLVAATVPEEDVSNFNVIPWIIVLILAAASAVCIVIVKSKKKTAA